MRGEGNHKIPASFAPENMEKTGAERVKYSLACQHEDAIPIKFVSYAQKCPTVLCTFAVALRKESVDRNGIASVACITVICYLAATAVKQTPLANKWLPSICGALGGLLGLAAMYINVPDFPATDPLTALAVGIVSGLAATGADQVIKQIGKGN